MIKNVLISLIFCLICASSGAQEVGYASFYHDYFTGRTTANGEKYDPNQLTAAHKSLPLGTVVKVTNAENNKSVIVRINDRGPYVKGRILDLSKLAATQLGIIESGFAKVTYEIIENKSPLADAKDTCAVQARDTFVEELPDEKFYTVNQVDTTVKMGFGVKLGNFADPKLAFIVSKQLKTKYNTTSYIQTVKLMNGSTYRIFVGNFPSQQDAEQLKEGLKSYSPDCVVVNYATYK